jgi:hypothetical protein
MPQYHFGLGQLALIPSGANPTPVQFAVLTDVTLDMNYDLKELRGQYQVAVDMARGPLKITGKAKNAAIASGVLLAFMAGGTRAAGTKIGIAGEAGTVPTTPFQITAANGATFFEDMGVVDLTTGLLMTRGASATGTGVYAVNTATGVYTFNTADSGHNVAISYSYTAAGNGYTTTLTNQLMQQSTPFIGAFYNTYGSKQLGWRFPAVHVPKLSWSMKAEAYTEQDLDFSVTQDYTSTKVVDIYSKE